MVVERAMVEVGASVDEQFHRGCAAVHGGLVERGELAPAAGVDTEAGVEQSLYDVGAVEGGELAQP